MQKLLTRNMEYSYFIPRGLTVFVTKTFLKNEHKLCVDFQVAGKNELLTSKQKGYTLRACRNTALLQMYVTQSVRCEDQCGHCGKWFTLQWVLSCHCLYRSSGCNTQYVCQRHCYHINTHWWQGVKNEGIIVKTGADEGVEKRRWPTTVERWRRWWISQPPWGFFCLLPDLNH